LGIEEGFSESEPLRICPSAIYYTDYGKETGRGILLASYTWSEDAQRWGSLTPQERIVQALENVSVIHPRILEEFETGASHMWHDDPFAGGAFALFDPAQSLLHSEIMAEGRVYLQVSMPSHA
jgi:monoamine oxidase